MATMGRDDPDMHMLWSPMSHEGHARYAALRQAITRGFAPPPASQTQQLRAKYAAGARRSGDAIFFEAFGSHDDDEHALALHTELFGVATTTSRTAQREPEREPAIVSRLAKPTRLPTPKRVSLKRARDASETDTAEKTHPARKPRFLLSDTTNIMRSSTTTTTTTMATPWDRHLHHQVLKPTSAANAAAFGASRVVGPRDHHATAIARPTATTAAFAPTVPRRDVAMSTRAFALR